MPCCSLLDNEEVDDFVGGAGIGGSDALSGSSGELASDWRLYLDAVDYMDSLDTSAHGDAPEASAGGGTSNGAGPKLSRRSNARLRAFLSSCRLAVPDDPFPTVPVTGSGAQGSGSGPTSVRATEAAKTAAAADTTARQLLGKPLHGNGNGKPKAQAQALPESAKVGADAASLETALSNFAVTDGDGKDRPKKDKAKGADGMKRQTSKASSFLKRPELYPQFDQNDLTVRIELYIRSLRRVRETGNECVMALEPPRAIKARVRGVVDSFVATVGCVRSIGPELRKLVGNLTKELLAVEVIGQDLLSAIGRLASEYEHQTSFASLAFLSSPEDSALAKLTPLVLSYVEYLQGDWENHVATCELESMLCRALDPEIRKMFKMIEFQSIGHLLDVCHQHREDLQNIMLPKTEEEDIEKQASDPKLLKQAMKDVGREKITVNGRSLPPAKTLRELIFVLTEALNSKPLTLSHGKKKRKSKRSKKQAAAAAAFRGANTTTDESAVESATSTSESEISSGTEDETGASASSGGDSGGRARMARRRSVIDTTTIEYMTRRILVAASRTGTGGDSYFVVRDLFGGEDVEVLPSLQGSGGTIELIVRLASVTIKCHGRYDVYPKPFNDRCEPLIQVHTTTEETVSMHEVRSTDGHKTVLTLQEKMTDVTGNRSLSIRPALYEKVADWRTPS